MPDPIPGSVPQEALEALVDADLPDGKALRQAARAGQVNYKTAMENQLMFEGATGEGNHPDPIEGPLPLVTDLAQAEEDPYAV